MPGEPATCCRPPPHSRPVSPSSPIVSANDGDETRQFFRIINDPLSNADDKRLPAATVGSAAGPQKLREEFAASAQVATNSSRPSPSKFCSTFRFCRFGSQGWRIIRQCSQNYKPPVLQAVWFSFNQNENHTGCRVLKRIFDSKQRSACMLSKIPFNTVQNTYIHTRFANNKQCLRKNSTSPQL